MDYSGKKDEYIAEEFNGLRMTNTDSLPTLECLGTFQIRGAWRYKVWRFNPADIERFRSGAASTRFDARSQGLGFLRAADSGGDRAQLVADGFASQLASRFAPVGFKALLLTGGRLAVLLGALPAVGRRGNLRNNARSPKGISQ